MSYSKFRQYGRKFSEHYGDDYVHNIWLRYFEKTGKDLFKEGKSNRWIYKAVKNEFINSLYASDRFEGILKLELDKASGESFLIEYLESTPTILENIIYNELDHFIKDKIRAGVQERSENSNACNFDKQLKLTLDIYEYLKMGYGTKQIADELKIHEQSVTNYKRQIKEAITYMGLINPFTGDTTIIKKSISQQIWDENSEEERSQYEEYDYNEYYILYKDKVGDGLLVKLKQGKFNKYLENK